ncbi:hypothetical protein [Bacillus sp. FJAT-45350]|nr:hypothetical protein [Bacillus sp. FJAT-45350]
MIKGLDLQLVGFLTVSLIREYMFIKQLPQVYYWDKIQDNEDVKGG